MSSQPLLSTNASSTTHTSSSDTSTTRRTKKKKPSFDREGGPREGGGRYDTAEERGSEEVEVVDCMCAGLSLFSSYHPKPGPATLNSLHRY